MPLVNPIFLYFVFNFSFYRLHPVIFEAEHLKLSVNRQNVLKNKIFLKYLISKIFDNMSFLSVL